MSRCLKVLGTFRVLILGSQWSREMYASPFTRLAVYTNLAPMARHDTFYDTRAQAGSPRLCALGISPESRPNAIHGNFHIQHYVPGPNFSTYSNGPGSWIPLIVNEDMVSRMTRLWIPQRLKKIFQTVYFNLINHAQHITQLSGRKSFLCKPNHIRLR